MHFLYYAYVTISNTMLHNVSNNDDIRCFNFFQLQTDSVIFSFNSRGNSSPCCAKLYTTTW